MADQEHYKDLPELGPARDELDDAPGESASAVAGQVERAPAAASHSSHKGLVFGIFMALGLAGGTAGWGVMELEKLLARVEHAQALQQNQQAALEHALSQLAVLEGQITSADKNASQSGAVLQAQVQKLAAAEAERRQRVDAELSQLAEAGEALEPRVDRLGQQVSEQQERLAVQEKKVAALAQSLEKQAVELAQRRDQIAAAGRQVEQQAAALATESQKLGTVSADLRSLTGELGQLKNTLAQQGRAQSVTDTRAREAGEGVDRLQRQVQTLVAELQAVQGDVAQARAVPAVSRLDKRLLDIEQAIDAFDGSRRQFNQELLQVKRRLNHLQLSLEQRSTAP